MAPTSLRRFDELIRSFNPDVVHLHNVFPLLSPMVIRRAKAARVPVVQTVHNYRHECVNGIHFRGGAACVDCNGRAIPWPALRHGCYQGGRLATLPMVAAQVAHRSTWPLVDLFLPVGEGVADELRRLGIAEDKVLVRPNRLEDPGEPPPLGAGVFYAGRLSDEKGIALLLEAWRISGLGATTSLTIAGAGDLEMSVKEAVASDPSIRYVGFLAADELAAAYRRSAVVAVPSLCFEAHPIAIVNALAHGRPVVATNTTVAATELSSGGGWLARPDATSFAATLRKALSDNTELGARGRKARLRFVESASLYRSQDLLSIYARLCTAGSAMTT